MTTITTWTAGPKAWKIAMVAAAAGLAALVVVSLPSTTSETTNQPAVQEANAALPEAIRGFEYENESTPGRVVSAGVTAEYFGDNGGVYPDENGPLIRTGLDQARIDLLAPVITQEFLDGPSSAGQGASRVDPGAAAAVGLNPGAIDEIVGGSTRVVPTPSFAATDDALVRGVSEAGFDTAPYTAYAEGMSAVGNAALGTPSFAASDDALVRGVSEAGFDTAPYTAYAEGMSAVGNAAIDWDSLGGPYVNGTVGDHYTETASSGRIPQQNVSMR